MADNYRYTMLFHIASALAALAVVPAVFACTPQLSEVTPYIVTSSQRTDVQWVANTIRSHLGVDLSTTVPGTPFTFAATTFGGYAISFNPEFNHCLFANGTTGNSPLYASEGCFNQGSFFTREQDFTFNCASCSERGGTGCTIVSGATKQCAAWASVGAQVYMTGCGKSMETWDVYAPSVFPAM